MLRTPQLLVLGAAPEGLELHAERVQQVARVHDHGAVALEAHPERQTLKMRQLQF